MKIELPTHKTTRKAELTPDLRTFTIIGANGAGKSRFGDDIAHKQKKNIFRLSALKALFVTPTNEVSVGTTITSLFNELQKKTTYRIETVETEFERLMYLLMYEEFINVMAYKHNESPNKGKLPRTKLDRVQRQWENIFPQNKMLRASGNISIVGGKDPRPYSPTRLSDGEKTDSTSWHRYFSLILNPSSWLNASHYVRRIAVYKPFAGQSPHWQYSHVEP